MIEKLTIRLEVNPADRDHIRDIVSSTQFFNDEEIDVAVELIDERLGRGDASGYYFLMADLGNHTIGYSCYGPISGTAFSYDLFWIAVHNDHRGKGFGKKLLALTEQAIYKAGGQRIYVETSSKDLYAPTRRFYEAGNYRLEAVIKDFYAPDDDKLIFVKVHPP